jgi:hypothetical protein
MTLITKHAVAGGTLFFAWPMSEEIIDTNGNHFSCRRWQDRLSDCRINGRAVNQFTYRRRKDEWKQKVKPVRRKSHKS